jgi:hypothetical protein
LNAIHPERGKHTVNKARKLSVEIGISTLFVLSQVYLVFLGVFALAGRWLIRFSVLVDAGLLINN